MSSSNTEGNCYICGKTCGKTVMKNHILKEHAAVGEEESFLLKIEGAYDKRYWLFVDIGKSKTLEKLDVFMRKIWLECCGHMSEFRKTGLYDPISKTHKLNRFAVGDKIAHDYDMGSTTECLITIVAETLRPKQRNAVRLLARNTPLVSVCAGCGKPAVYVCQQCMYSPDNADYCEACADEHEHEFFNKITNSPRNGECGYDGELDTYGFEPEKYK